MPNLSRKGRNTNLVRQPSILKKHVSISKEVFDVKIDSSKPLNSTVSAFNLEAFGEEQPNLTSVTLKSFFSVGEREYSHMYTGQSKHPNFVNLNVLYNKKNASKAAAIRKREQELEQEKERKRIIMEQRNEFNKSIRKEEGKLSV